MPRLLVTLFFVSLLPSLAWGSEDTYDLRAPGLGHLIRAQRDAIALHTERLAAACFDNKLDYLNGQEHWLRGRIDHWSRRRQQALDEGDEWSAGCSSRLTFWLEQKHAPVAEQLKARIKHCLLSGHKHKTELLHLEGQLRVLERSHEAILKRLARPAQLPPPELSSLAAEDKARPAAGVPGWCILL